MLRNLCFSLFGNYDILPEQVYATLKPDDNGTDGGDKPVVKMATAQRTKSEA